jgi:H+/gluconate symporter-like permease
MSTIEIMLWVIVGLLTCILVVRVWGKRNKKDRTVKASEGEEGEEPEEKKDEKPEDVKAVKEGEVKWMCVKVWMREPTYEMFKNYLEYQGALQTVEKGSAVEITPDEAINELLLLHTQNVKIFGKASTKELCKAIEGEIKE